MTGRALHHRVIQLSISAAYLFGAHALFKANWPALLSLAGSPKALFVWGTWGLHLTQLVLSNLVFAAIYAAGVPFLEQYKIAKKPWPWRSEKPAIRELFWTTLRQALMLIAFNQVVVALPSAFTAYDIGRALGAFSVSLDDFPTPLTLVWQCAVCAVVEDTLFYWCHRALHTRLLHRYIHKWHHRFNNAASTVTIASENANPIEYVVGNLIPVIAGPVLLRGHTFLLWFWVAIRIAETTDAHSGYEFPWSPARLTSPIAISAAHHDYHHSSNNGCFGSQFVFWDWLCGTDRAFNAAHGKTAVDGGDMDGAAAADEGAAADKPKST